MCADWVMFEHARGEKHVVARKGPKLDELPGEILTMIAECMTKDQLRLFRELFNRRIAQHIDHVFAEAHLSHRVCKITNRSAEHLRRLRTDRFIKHMRTLEIRLDLHWRIEQPEWEYFQDLYEIRTPDILDERKFFGVIESVIGKAGKLREIIIQAPSNLVYTFGGSLIVRSVPLHASVVQRIEWAWQMRASLDYFQGRHDPWSMCNFVGRLIRRTQAASKRLQKFRLLGFADSEWQSSLASAEWILHELAYDPALENLTSLDLQLELFPHNDNRCLLNLVQMTNRNAKLKALRIRSGPRAVKNYHKYTEDWAPLLHQLGHNPPFRLQTLELEGLATSKWAPTLDQIIDTHSPTLRRIVLEHTNFHYPNSLRAFFCALARSKVNHYKSNWFFVHRKFMLVASCLTYTMVPDEVLKPASRYIAANSEESDWDWVIVDWIVCSESTPLVYDNEDGRHGENWMRDSFLNTIVSINSGVVRDT